MVHADYRQMGREEPIYARSPGNSSFERVPLIEYIRSRTQEKAESTSSENRIFDPGESRPKRKRVYAL